MASRLLRKPGMTLGSIFCLALLIGCTQTATPTIEIVQFFLLADTSTISLMEELVAAYQVQRTYVSIQIESAANAEQVLAAIHAEQVVLASVSWLPDSEKTEPTFWYRSIARDPIAVITHSTNPVGDVTLLQLRRIYQGQTFVWTELGGEAIDVVAVSRESGAGVRASFESLVMGNRDVAPTSIVMPSNETVVDFVSRTPGAIGYVSSAWLVPTVNLLTVEGVNPSLTSVKDGRYLLSRPFFLIASDEPEGGIADFVLWVTEGAGQEIIKRHYALAP